MKPRKQKIINMWMVRYKSFPDLSCGIFSDFDKERNATWESVATFWNRKTALSWIAHWKNSEDMQAIKVEIKIPQKKHGQKKM